MPTVFVKPNDKKRQYSRVQHLSAIEMPAWLSFMAKAQGDSLIVDMEAEDLDEMGLILRLKDFAVDEVVLLATGSHPSAHIQQSEAADRLKKGVEAIFAVPVRVENRLYFDPTLMGVIPYDKLPVKLYRAHNWHSWGRPDRSYGVTFSSISCPFKCDFCCVKDFYHSDYRQRDPRLVVEDVKALVAKGVTNIKMMDELFAIDNKGTRAVCELLKAEGLGELINIWAYARIDTVSASLLKSLRGAGVRWLAYGIESGNEAIRAGTMKGKFTNAHVQSVIQMTKDHDISIVGNYMFGFWEDGIASMRETLDLAKALNCEYSNFYCMSVYPGSRLYDEMKSRGVALPLTSEEFAQMSPNFKPVPTKTLDGRFVMAFRDAAFNEYFRDPGYLAMMGARFGAKAVEEIKAMTSIEIR
ncbi:MAG: radical SAM protein [Candidatus Omnitrophica bacterium]|nr:radical SAM protein [Candidatus Omnitrophota bacterium]